MSGGYHFGQHGLQGGAGQVQQYVIINQNDFMQQQQQQQFDGGNMSLQQVVHQNIGAPQQQFVLDGRVIQPGVVDGRVIHQPGLVHYSQFANQEHAPAQHLPGGALEGRLGHSVLLSGSAVPQHFAEHDYTHFAPGTIGTFQVQGDNYRRMQMHDYQHDYQQERLQQEALEQLQQLREQVCTLGRSGLHVRAVPVWCTHGVRACKRVDVADRTRVRRTRAATQRGSQSCD
jgi:hypothetical protein